ncbi:DNA glycosylase [Tothia fuscella]|uniref:Endonuclease III homolog n=1 Tax=Tothia fuscella TaxID=1048955 RepID=A0A9P4NIP7_9PEZI|nr:DNA glycosylase [Tothia fuscella]
MSRETARVISAIARSPRPIRRMNSQSASDTNITNLDNHSSVAPESTEVKVKAEIESSPTHLDDVETSTTSVPPSRKRKRPSGVKTAVKPEETELLAESTPKPRKARRQPAKRVKTESGDVKIEAPPNWEEMYNLTKEMRKTITAPVDTMGCERLADIKDTPRNQRFQTLISLMLSSQTKDTVTAVAIQNLQRELPGSLTLESILAIEPSRLNDLIGKVGFHNIKTKHIKQTAEILHTQFNDDIPTTIEGLISLPGVGPKMAYLCMSAAWGRDEGIGVDVHVHRITNLWGWHKTSSPEETRKSLEGWLPREKWHEINHLLVGLGQVVCLPVGRRCGECVLAGKGVCPGAQVGKGKKVMKREVKREVLVKEEVKHIGEERMITPGGFPDW